ncbi:flippase [Synechocystis salina LEGE 00031]|uniref:Flippase n=2 Tax=Synechocystis TaxID=1142 RepID=A0ABR9VRU0_9SYNC|nr:flippase [Synechocystis salina LEGE 00041]MBE9254064.1 flippase [Synechocystis salina LEGE 00031]
MGVGLFVFTLVARYLGVEQFGMYSFATAFVGLFSTLATMGLPSLVVKSLTHEPERQNEILGTTFCLQLLGGIGSLVLSLLAVLLFRNHDPLTVSLVAILASAGIFHAFDTIDIWYQSQVKSKYTVIAKNTAFIIFAVVKLTLIHFQAPLLAFAGATIAEVLAGAMGLVISYQVLGYSLWRWRWDFSVARELLQQSWPLILSGFTIMIYMKTDQVMLGEMIGDDAVGLYSAATRISEVWYFIPTAIVSSVAPSIYQAKREGNELAYYQKISKLLKFLNTVAIMIAIPMTFLSGSLIDLLFGPEFSGSSAILSIHIWAALFVFMGVASSPWFIAEDLTSFSFYRTLLGAIANMLLNFLLIPRYAGEGAAVATVISYGVGSVFANGLSVKTRDFFFLQVKSIFPMS